MKADCDVLIAGAGPGGAALASLAAVRGLRVTLLDRAAFPRDKVCGEFVSAEGRESLARLGLLDELRGAGAVTLVGCRLSDLRGACLDLPLPRLPGVGRDALGVSRERMDAALVDLARSRGVTVLERCEAHAPVLAAGRVAGLVVREVGGGQASRELRAPLVVAADGRRSMLARVLHPPLSPSPTTARRVWFGLKTHFVSSPAALAGRVELHLFDGGYAGLAAVEGGRVNLCLLVSLAALRACGGSPDRLLRERVLANPAARRVCGGMPRDTAWQAVGPLRWGARSPAAAGALFLGDAAGTVDPFSGEGMSNALCGAEAALEYVVAAAARGRLDAELQAAWCATWHRRFGAVTRRVRRIGTLLERPRLAGAALWLLRGPGRLIAPRLVAGTRTGTGG